MFKSKARLHKFKMTKAALKTPYIPQVTAHPLFKRNSVVETFFSNEVGKNINSVSNILILTILRYAILFIEI